ncbi:hypothetical protein EG328_006598 [Venturia inaequalis]|uniref:NAD-dependent epimerase/dehydratase domain-containing protein n=1 Tax=Venturia inaequalis TaxID=5025 RepID=A0A8H3VEF4_VENIN|nr:hypothetical protein EG328_006598 [Venturia inaequalis]RDI78059.1 hypothetical protein Vi05172_g11943 [Venturia inaequalis]
MSPITNRTLPEGSLILVTGVNGFIGSHIADQILLAGYRVRGIVRNAQKNVWMTKVFDGRYGKGKFELLEVKDLAEIEVLKNVLQDVHGVVHTASDVSFGADPNKVITPTIKYGLDIIKTAATIPTIKRFVYTSSSTAATMPYPNKEFTIDHDSWDEPAVEQAWAPAPYEPTRAYAVYAASKTQTEQALWTFVKEQKPGFVFNTVLPDTTLGPAVSPKDQGNPSTAAFVANLAKATREEFEGLVSFLPPQYFVDVRDIARLHVIALLDPEVENERVFGFAEPFNFNDILAIFRKNIPHKTFQEDWPGLGRDISTVSPKARSIELLKSFGRDGFVTLEQSIMDHVVEHGLIE